MLARLFVARLENREKQLNSIYLLYMSRKDKNSLRNSRRIRIRSRVAGTEERPRLCVFRSNKQIYAQLIDDTVGKTLTSSRVPSVTDGKETQNKVAQAALVGKDIAQKAQDIKIKKVVFDRAGYTYHGRVKMLAESAREAGLDF